MMACPCFLQGYAVEADHCLGRVFAVDDDTWIHHFTVTNKRFNMEWKHFQLTQKWLSGDTNLGQNSDHRLLGSLSVLLVDAQITCYTEKLAKYFQENISRSSKRGDGVILLHDNVRKHMAQRFGTCCKISVGKCWTTSTQADFGPQ
jgi:hypothetical protein